MMVKQSRLLGFLLATLIGAVATLPLLRGMPVGVDTLFHLYRLVQVDGLIQNGVFFSRWAPDLAQGFGYPLFNYYSPAAYYLAELLNLAGLPILPAFLATFALAMVAAAVFCFLWVRDILGEAGALVAAALYVFTPYMMDVALRRGSLAEQVALAFFPLILWAFRRFLLSQRFLYALIGTLAYGLLILTHNISALLFTLVLTGYLFVVTYSDPAKGSNGSTDWLVKTLKAGWLLILSLGMTAFFWLPALAERNLVQIARASAPLIFDFNKNFLSLSELFAPPFVYDPNLVTRDSRISLGLMGLLTISGGFLGFWRFRKNKGLAAQIVFALIVVLGSLFLTLPLSRLAWERLPLLPLIQFPWRFLAISILCAAFLGGSGVAAIMDLMSDRVSSQSTFVAVIPAVVIFLAAVNVVPWRFADYFDPLPDASVAGSMEYERESGLIGTTSTGEYLPVSVRQLPFAQEGQETYERLDGDSLPEGARLIAEDYGPLRYDIVVDSPRLFTAIFNTFFFEGWQATIDGQQALLRATDRQGLISLEVPQGEHRLQILFRSTLVRQLGSLISLVSLVLFILTMIRLARSRPSKSSSQAVMQPSLVLRQYGLLAATLLLILFLETAYFNKPGSLFKKTWFDGHSLVGVGEILEFNFDDELILIGLVAPEIIAADEPVEVVLYWRVPQATKTDYSVSTFLLDKDNYIVGQHDNQYAGDHPSSLWLPGQYAQDKHTISLVPGTPPGIYDLQVAVYESGKPNERLNVLDQAGAPGGRTLAVSEIAVERPKSASKVEDLEIEERVEVKISEAISFIGYSLPDYTLQPGETVDLVLYWLALQIPGEDMVIQLQLRDSSGALVQSLDAPPVPSYPSSLWQKDDVWRARHPLLLDPELVSGNYVVSVGVGDERPIDLGSIEVGAPEHMKERPPIQMIQSARFNGLGTLEGFETPIQLKAGETLPVTLFWRAAGGTQTGYKVFVQLLDAGGQLVAGSDQVPGEWRRPTSGWIAGEYIIDAHVLNLPADLEPGTYTLIVGLYDPDTMQRLRSNSGSDAVTLNRPLELLP